MKIIKINLSKINPKIVSEAAKIIKSGGVVAMPFDTCYGLTTDATNPKAIRKIYQIKKRAKSKPISTVFKDLKMAKIYTKITAQKEKNLKKYFPGPFTIILPAQKQAKIATRFQNTISIRIPDFPLTLALASLLKKPYTATSANISGKKSLWSTQKLILEFKNQVKKPDLILDAGNLPPNPTSQIIDFTQLEPKIIKRRN